MSKFLIIQTAFIGDVILATSLVEKLSIKYPAAKIDFLLRKGNESLINGNPNINKVLVWDKLNKKYASLIQNVQKIRKEKYDFVINVHRFSSSGLITAFSGGDHKIGFRNNPFSFLFNQVVEHSLDGDHEITRNHKLIAEITDEQKVNPKLYLSEDDFTYVLKYKVESYYCIAPCSVWFTKQYPKEKWLELIAVLDKKIFLLGGKADFDACNDLVKEVKNNEVVNLAGCLSFLQTAALMKDAKMNYVNDSAPLHLASSVNAPVTAIFCSTIPEFGFTPLSQDAKIVQTTKSLECRPCGIHGHRKCPKDHFECAKSISVDQFEKP